MSRNKHSCEAEPKELADGTVDYRESSFIPTVGEGVPIAKITQAVPGTPGVTVKGEQRLPKPVKGIVIRAGKGVRMLGQEEIISLMSGRPHVQKRGNRVKIDLLKQYEHDGDVNLKSGNMYFDGDIHIKGNVDDAMKVEAKEDVAIDRSVSKAAVQSGHCIEVKGNVFSSTLSSGKSNMIVSELTNTLQEIVIHLEHVQKSLHFLLNEAKIRKLEVSQTWDVFRLITGKKNAPMISEIKQFIQKTTRCHNLIDEEWSGLSMHLYKLFFTLPPYVKGGSVYAGTFIKIKEAGSESGVKTKFDIQAIGRIEFLKVHLEVSVQFGMKQLTFYHEEGPVCLFVGEDGLIKKASLTGDR
ncbi:FapA family protein [Domibacillus tundrae]|uniref:FapA family protein n=1 Tax=Domibacillus tundrae TaxID=1587527 RepID=UPI000617BC81|nr:FapA family protein [Domibacillus tundrae]